MGRKTDLLLRGFRAAKCLTELKLTTSRIKLLKNKKSVTIKQMRRDIAQLLKSGQEAHVYITKADTLIREENLVAVYDLIDQFCHSIISRFPMIETQRNCPIDMKEPIASLIFAAPRCTELAELTHVKDLFTAKYGKEFAAAAAELRPECGVNRQIIEKLSTRPASGQMKLKLMKDICVENNIKWTPGDALTEPLKDLSDGASQNVVKVDLVRVTEEKGSTKSLLAEAESLRISEAGSLNVDLDAKDHSQGGSRHGGNSSFGPPTPAESLKAGDGVTSATDGGTRFELSPASLSGFGTKHGSFSDEEAARVNVRVSESFKGVVDEGASSSNTQILGSLKGLTDPEAEAHEEKVEYQLQPVVDAQDGMSDSGSSESYVSVEEERFQDEVLSPMRAASRTESLTKNSFKVITEDGIDDLSLNEKSLRASEESSSSMESSHEGNSIRASRENSLNMKEYSEEVSFRASSRENSWSEKKLAEEKSCRENRENSLSKKNLAEEKSFSASEGNSLQRKELSGEKSFRASRENSLNMKKLPEEKKSFGASEVMMTSSEGTIEEMNNVPVSEMQKVTSSSANMCVEPMYFQASKENSLNLEKPSEIGSGEESSVPALEKTVQEAVRSSFSVPVNPEYSHDFATTAQAIAAEAVRLALLEYARRYAGSSSISMGLGDLTNLDLAFGENMKAKQAENLNIKGKQATSGSQGQSDEDDNTSTMGYRDVTKQKKSSKATVVDHDDDDYDMDDTGYKWNVTKEKSKQSSKPAVDDDDDDNMNDMGYRWDMTKDEAKQLSKMGAVDENINPFAVKIAAAADEELNPFLLKTGGDEGINRMSMSKPESIEKSGGMVGQEEEEFTRQTFWRPVEKPRLDEGRHSFVKVNASFDEEIVPSYGYGKHEINGEDKVARRPIFDQVPSRQSLFSEEGSKSYKSPDFDEGFRSYKSAAYDKGPESYKSPFSFDDDLDESTFSDGISDQELGYQSSPKYKPPTSFYLEPEPLFDEVAEEEEEPSMSQMTSQHMDQLRWNYKKSTEAQHKDYYHDEQVTTGETWHNLSSMSDASTSGTGHAMSRRSRREPQRMDEYDYDSEKVVGAKSAADGDSSSQVISKRSTRSPTRLAQQHQVEQEENKDCAEDSGHVMSKRSSMSRQWASQQQQEDLLVEGELDKWDSMATTSATAEGRFMSNRTTKSPTRLAQRQQMTLEESDEVHDYAEGKNWEGNAAGSRGRIMSKRTTRSPTRLAQQQQVTREENDEVQDDAEVSKWEATSSGGHATSKKSVRSPIRWAQQEQAVLEQDLLEEGQLDKWDSMASTSATAEGRFISKRTTKSPTRLAQRQQMTLEESDEVHDYAEGRNWEGSAAGSRGRIMSKRTSRSPTRLAQQQQVTLEENDEVQDDAGVSKWEVTSSGGHATSKRSVRSPIRWAQQEQAKLEQEEVSSQENGVVKAKWDAISSATLSSGSDSMRRSSLSHRQQKMTLEDDFSEAITGGKWDSSSAMSAVAFAESGHTISKRSSRWPKLVQQLEEKDAAEEVVGEKWQASSTMSAAALEDSGQVTMKMQPTQQHKVQPFERFSSKQPGTEYGYASSLMAETEVQETTSGYKPFVRDDELGKTTPSSLLSSQQQRQCRQEEQTPASGYKPFVEGDDLGKRIPSSQLSGRLQQRPQEEQDLAPGYKPFVQGDLGKRIPSSPLSSRQQQRHEEEHDPESGYKPFVQVDELGRRMPSMPLPDQQQELRQGEQQSLSEEEPVERLPAKLDTQAPPPARPPPLLPPRSTSSPLASSISDPIILATIPPPPKISATPPPAATKLATAISAPPASATSSAAASTSTGANVAATPKLPQRPPDLDVLAARFEALRKAKRGEGPPMTFGV